MRSPPAARVRAHPWTPRSVVATLQVELVAVERKIWSGEARMVIARTTEGELGVLPGHAPLLGQLAEGRGVTILAETAEISTEIDVERAREALRRAEEAGEDDAESRDAARRAQSRLR